MSEQIAPCHRESKPFHGRGFTSLTLGLAFLVLAVSGVVLFVSPQGRVANWTGWAVLGLSKHDWAEVHTTVSGLFLTVAALHLFFNWKVLLHYLKSRAQRGRQLRRELAAAALLLAVTVGGTLAGWPPFATVIGVGEAVKSHWARTSPTGPVAHAEELTIEQYARRADWQPEQVKEVLAAAGWTGIELTATVADVAAAKRSTPAAMDALVRQRLGATAPAAAAAGSGSGRGARHGIGRMTLAEYCTAEALPLQAALATLSARGVSASGEQTMRDLAIALQVDPPDVADLIGRDASPGR